MTEETNVEQVASSEAMDEVQTTEDNSEDDVLTISLHSTGAMVISDHGIKRKEITKETIIIILSKALEGMKLIPEEYDFNNNQHLGDVTGINLNFLLLNGELKTP